MDKQEYETWARFQMKHAGHWTVDPIHDGVHRDLIAYIALPKDLTKGIYVAIEKDGAWSVGKFEDGCPARGPVEGVMIPNKHGKAADYNQALTQIVETLGLSFLLALTHGSSPYRSL